MQSIKTKYHNDFIVDTAVRKLYKVSFTLMPKNWENYDSLVDLKWKMVEFNEKNVETIPDDHGGVYSFVVFANVANHPECAYPIYVGETNCFKRRYNEYLRDRFNPKARPLIRIMLGLWGEHLRYCFAQIENVDLISTVEENLIRAFDPIINSEFPKDVQATVTAAAT